MARAVTRIVIRAAPAHTMQARLWWDSQAGGLTAAGTPLDWPYWVHSELVRGLPSCRLSDSKGLWLGPNRSGLSGGPQSYRTLPGLCKGAPWGCGAGWAAPGGPPQCGVDRPPAAPTVVGGGTGAVPGGGRPFRAAARVGLRPPSPWRGVVPVPPLGLIRGFLRVFSSFIQAFSVQDPASINAAAA